MKRYPIKRSTQPQIKQPQTQDTDTAPAVDVEALQRQLRARESELKNATKRLQEIETDRTKVLKDKESYVVRNELKALARGLNVHDTALDDVVSLLGNKFTYRDDKLVVADSPDAEPDKFLGEWLATKQHYVAPTVAKSTGATPFPQNQPTSKTVDINDREAVNAYFNHMRTTRR